MSGARCGAAPDVDACGRCYHCDCTDWCCHCGELAPLYCEVCGFEIVDDWARFDDDEDCDYCRCDPCDVCGVDLRGGMVQCDCERPRAQEPPPVTEA